MQLLVYYVIFVIVGDVIDYGIGLFVERMWGDTPGLFVFLACYFLLLWLAWVLAVRITEPKTATEPA